MPIDRPTFSESWYRICELKPRLRATAQIHRQQYRGQLWYVVEDPANNQFFRLNPAAHRFVGLLNGRRTVAEVWDICNGQLGDEAPTQGEAIQLLGQLYVSNLLMVDVSPDAEGLFRRFHKRRTREVKGYLTNFLFIRIPLFDPDRILNTFLPAVSWMWSWIGAVLWTAIVSTGLYFVITNLSRAASRASGVLDPSNLPLLFAGFWLIKVCHEFGHAFACKTFGRRQGGGGEVHVMGIMLLVFAPLPYVDASSSWALRSKWRRACVGAAGMIVEFAIAAIAAIIWAHTADGTTVNALCYNMMFVASVSTLLFNANPLLRYDGYYILSDLLEIPNLAQRGKEYVYYLVKRYLWRVRNVRSPAHTRGERFWLLSHGIASTIYRFFICAAILLFVAQKLFMVGVVLAIAAGIAWVMMPLGKFVKYLLTSGELSRVRTWAIASTLIVFALIIGGIGFWPRPERFRVEGVIEPAEMRVVYAGEKGFVTTVRPSGQAVAPGERPLLESTNEMLLAQRDLYAAELKEMAIRRRMAMDPKDPDPASAAMYAEQMVTKRKQLARAEQRLGELSVSAPLAGTWISPDIEDSVGTFVDQGQTIGVVARLDDMRIRAVLTQDEVAALIDERQTGKAAPRVEVRIKGRPDLAFGGSVVRVTEAGSENLPSAAMGYAAGGSVATDPKEPTKAARRVFEVEIRPDDQRDVRLLAGQRVVVRVRLSDKPLAIQWYRGLLQLFQRRFQT